MPLEIYLTTDERTALSYLIKPFSDQVARAFKER
jgi:HlyD family secretion protein